LKTKGLLTNDEAEKLFDDALSNNPEDVQEDAHFVFETAQASFADTSDVA
jgi:hypothetical protein